MTDTPRTDEQISGLAIEAGNFRSMYYEALDYWNTMSEFARALERELIGKSAECAKLRAELNNLCNSMALPFGHAGRIKALKSARATLKE